MMTLAQFYATHRLADAIVVPAKVSRLIAKRRTETGILLTPDSVSAEHGVQAAQMLRRFRIGPLRGKKN